MPIIVGIFILIVIGAAGAASYFYAKSRREQAFERWVANRRNVVLKISVPKNNDKTPKSAESFFAALHGIYRADEQFHDHLSFEIAATDKAIEFFVQCPAELRDFVEGQIYAQYPNVEMQEVSDYARAEKPGLKVASADLVLNRPDIYPIKSFQSFEVDPLAAITGVLAKINNDEQVWIQVLARPISDSWQEKSIKYVSAARNGTLKRPSFWKLLGKGLVEFVRPAVADPKAGGPPKLGSGEEQALKAAEEKATKLGYETKIRILVLAPDLANASTKVMTVGGVFKQFNTINTNGFSLGKVVTEDKALADYQQRAFWDKGSILNTEELASVFHFPNVTVETPNIVWAGAKKGEPPASIPLEGSVPPDDLTILGMTDFRGHKQRFGIKIPDRRQHMYAIGKSGTGKSTLLENMAIDDIRKGRGVAIVDPHGDFINTVLNFIPASRVNDVIYFNPADREFCIGFNLLENVDPELKNVVASGVLGVFEKIFGELSWGPRLEYILRNVILALMDYPGATMLSIMRMLVDKAFRVDVLNHVTDPVIRDFFINEYEKYDPKFRTEAIAPIQNKVGQFLSASTIRNIVGQPQSTFDIDDAMNTGKIVLMDLSIGKIGEDSATLLGAMMITKIQMSAMRRQNIEDKEKRRDFYLYVDEFQNFATDSFATILSEARKYRLNLILTHQYIAQLPETVTKAIFGNIGTMVAFRVGSTDAVPLVKEFEPVFDANDMVNLGNHHIYAKMSIDGVTRPAFSAVTLPPATEPNNNRDKIIRVSRERYARPREFVEAKILEIVESTVGSTGQDLSAAATGPAKPKGQLLPPLEVEGKWYQSRQDKDGRHWYFEVEPPADPTAVLPAGVDFVSGSDLAGDKPVVEAKKPEPVEPPVQTKPVEVQPITKDKESDEAKHVNYVPKEMSSVAQPTIDEPKSSMPADREVDRAPEEETRQASQAEVKPANTPEPVKMDAAQVESPKPIIQVGTREERKETVAPLPKPAHNHPQVPRQAMVQPVKDAPEEPNQARASKQTGSPQQSSNASVKPLEPDEIIVLRD